jgi:transketolase
MRDAFVRTLTELAAADPRVVLLTADLGYRLFDDFERRCPGRFFNVGVAEANMIGIAAGLALDGKRPFAYSIVPFVTARCLEQIRNDVCEMELPVTIVGVGGGYAYGPNGPTHHGVDDVGMMRTLPGITVLAPCDPRETAAAVEGALAHTGPVYLRLGRANEPLLPGTDRDFVIGTPTLLRRGREIALVACGPIAAEALQAAETLAGRGLDPAVLSVHTVKPLGTLSDWLIEFDRVFVVEEHGPCGGLFEAMAGEVARTQRHRPLLHQICAPDRFHRLVGSSAFLRAASGVDASAIAGAVVSAVEAGHG